MSHPGTNGSAKAALLRFKRVFFLLHDTWRSQDDGEETECLLVSPVPRSLHPPPQPSLLPRLESKSSPIPDADGVTLLERYAQMARELIPSLPPIYPLLSPEDIRLMGGHPVAAGGFADILEATHDGRKVVLKSYRCYILFDVAQVVARFQNEVHVHSLLRHRDVDVVPLVGVYSTERHPFGLVYEYMDGLDLEQHLRNEPNVERLKLLTVIARSLSRMHNVGVVHRCLNMANVLVNKDGTVHIAGLGNASILPHFTGMSSNVADHPHSTKAGDVYNFGVMAFEVFTERPPLYKTTKIATAYSMLTGSRPPRPDHHEVSDPVWGMIESCWHNVASRRMPMEEVVDTLGEELNRISSPSA